MKRTYERIQLVFLLLLTCLWAQSQEASTRGGIIVGPGDPTNPTTQSLITVTSGTNGRISPSGDALGKVFVNNGANQPFAITPSDGYEIDEIKIDGGIIALSDDDRSAYQYVFPNVTSAHTVSATFKPIRFTLTASAGPGGTISPHEAVVVKGASQTFTAIPSKGYQMVDLIDNGISKGVQTSYVLTNIQDIHTLQAKFKGTDCVVTLPTALTGGTLSVTYAGGTMVRNGDALPYGTILTVTNSAASGYQMDKLTVNGNYLTTEAYVIKGDAVFAVSFRKKTYPVTVNAPTNGSLTVMNGTTTLSTGIYQIEHGTVLNLTNKPAAHYTFGSYKVSPNLLTEEKKVTVTEAVSINATFNAATYEVTVTKPSEGTLSINAKEVQSSGATSYPYGTVLNLSNTPSSKKILDRYQVKPAAALNGNQVIVNGNLSIEALFKNAPDDGVDGEGNILYTITYAPPLIVRLADGTAVASNSKVKKTTALTLAVSNTNSRKLVSLTGNGNPIEYITLSGLNTAVYEVAASVEFKAVLQDVTYPIVVHPSEGGSLQAQVGGVPVVSGNLYPSGSVVTATATPEKDYRLDRILAGGTDITVSRRITLTEDLVLNTLFIRKTEINPNPDPGNPDPAQPVGIELAPQSVVYNRKAQAFMIRTQPAGMIDNIKVTYKQKGAIVSQPIHAGLYDVTLTRTADSRFAELNETITEGLEILQAPVTITSIDYEEYPIVGLNPKTNVVLKGGKAVYLGEEVKGQFTWESNPKSEKLEVMTTQFVNVIFTPSDVINYQNTSGRIHVQVGTVPTTTYTITVKTEGEGSTALFSGNLIYPTSGPFYENMSLTLIPTAKTGYRFAGFVKDGVLYANNPYTFTITKNQELTARFVKKEDPANPSDPSKPTDPNAPAPLKVTIGLPADLVYNGKAKLATFTSVPAISGWKIEYRDKNDKVILPLDAGDYRVTISREEDDAYLAYKEVKTFTITKATPVIVKMPETEPILAGAALGEVVLKGGRAEVVGLGVTLGAFEWSTPQIQLKEAGEQTVLFVPTDRTNYYTVTDKVMLSITNPDQTAPILITYAQPLGGTIQVFYEKGFEEETPNVLPSGTFVAAGTKIRMKVTAAPNYELASFWLGAADCTADAVIGDLVRTVYTSKDLVATFTRKPDPVDPEKPDPDNPSDPGTPGKPDNPSDPSTPSTPDDPDYPTPDYPDRTVWVRSTGLGSITPGTSRVSYGGSLSFEVTPGYGQQLVDVRVNGSSVGAATNYLLKKIRENMVVEAVFSNAGIPIYTLTSRILGEGYCIPQIVRVTRGSNHQFVLHTRGDARVIDVQIGTEKKLKSIGKPTSYIFRDVTADSLLVATFTGPTANETMQTDAKGQIVVSGSNLHVSTTLPEATLCVYQLDGQRLVRQKITENFAIVQLHTNVYIAELSGKGLLIRKKVIIQ